MQCDVDCPAKWYACVQKHCPVSSCLACRCISLQSCPCLAACSKQHPAVKPSEQQHAALHTLGMQIRVAGTLQRQLATTSSCAVLYAAAFDGMEALGGRCCLGRLQRDKSIPKHECLGWNQLLLTATDSPSVSLPKIHRGTLTV